MSDTLARLEAIAAELPQAQRVDIAAWDGQPTFRVRGKNFIFCSADAGTVTVKLPKEEAAAVVATEEHVEPTGYGLGRHGWVSITLGAQPDWEQLREWIRTSYSLVAPKTLAREVIEQDSA